MSGTEKMQLLAIDQPNVLLSTIKKAEDGNELIVRLAEMTGQRTPVKVTLPREITHARRVTVLEYPQESVEKPQFKGRELNLNLGSHEIVTVALKMKK